MPACAEYRLTGLVSVGILGLRLGLSRQASHLGASGPDPSRFSFNEETMHLCYVDESGTPHIPGNTSHYILAGLSIPDEYWKTHHNQIEAIKRRHGLAEAEIHVAWMMRPYVEQNAIPDFGSMTQEERRSRVRSARTSGAPPATASRWETL